MRTFLEDFKFSLRLIKKTPIFSLTCLIVITLGLAVGISNYSLTQAFRKPPPFIEGDRFVGISINNEKTGEGYNWDYFNAFTFNAIKELQQSFEFVDGTQFSNVSVINEGLASRHYLASVTPTLLTNTKARPLLGRVFSENDLTASQGPVVVIAFNLWQTSFLGDSDIIGRSIEIDGVYHSIIGVMPENFNYPMAQDIWRLDAVSPQAPINGSERIGIIGKRLPGISNEAATADINRIITQLEKELPQQLDEIEAEVTPIGSVVTGSVRGVRELFMALTLVIFLIASLNLSTLLYTRANQRTQELAVRNAVGANTWQLRKQVLLESGLLCLIGCLIGLLLSYFLLQVVQRTFDEIIQSQGATFNLHFGISASGLKYALGMTIAIWLLSSFITVYKISSASLQQSLDGASKGATSRTGALTTRLVVGIELVFSCFLLILCGVFTFSIIGTYQLDYGSKGTNLYVGEFAIPQNKFENSQEQAQFFQTLSQEISNKLSTTSVSFTNSPAGGWNWPESKAYSLDDRDLSNQSLSNTGIYPTVIVGAVSNYFFSNTGVDIIEGREFDSRDTHQSQQVVVIDANLANNLWPNESPIGKRLQLDPINDGPWLTIVGVNNHIIHGTPMGDVNNRFAIYRPISQHNAVNRTYIILETGNTIPIADLFSETRKSFAIVDRNIALNSLVPYQEFMTDSKVINRFFAEIAGWFSSVTLLLSVVGVYAIVARSIILRRREIGIRQALGSTKSKITHLFLRQGFIYLLVGIIIGGGAALVVSGGLANLFPNINNSLFWVGATVILTMSILIFMASYLPTRRALSIEPGDALREE